MWPTKTVLAAMESENPRNGDGYTRIPVYPETRDRIRAAKVGGESYDDVVNRLLNQAGSDKEVAIE